MNRKDINVKSESAMKETDMANVSELTWEKRKNDQQRKENSNTSRY